MAGPLDYSTTAASNTTVGGVNVAEGMAPGSVNDAMRAMMADSRKWQLDWSGVTTAGSSNAYTMTCNQGITAYADGMRFSFRADRNNTGAATLNIDGRGAKALRKVVNGALAALDANDLVAKAIYDAVFLLADDVFVIVGNQPVPLAGRNRIINGQGRVNQRSYVSGAATGGANQYTLDRWRVVTSGQSLTFTGNDAGRTMTAPAGGCEQVIEGANIEGGTYVINWTGTATCTVDGVSRAKGATFTLTANTDATVRMIGGTFTDVQVELGAVATPFERLPYGDELSRCQRYYQFGTARFDGQVTSGTGESSRIQFAVTMRIAPAIAQVNASNANFGATPSNETITANGFSSRRLASGTGAGAFVDTWTADAEI
jgi:hypothetical protein